MVCEKKTAFLKSVVVGPFSGKVYGRAGELVQVVSVMGNMAIVQGGERFPVRIEQLSSVEPKSIDDAPAPAPMKPPGRNKPVQSKTKKGAISSQTQSLF
jgi:hypothetical protein